MNISEHITYAEATKSQTATRLGIKNEPNEDQLESMKLWAKMIFEPVREYCGHPLAITSFFRALQLNRAIGSTDGSQHPKGEAGDIDADVFGGKSNSEIFLFVREVLDYDQLIWEFGDDITPNWVHVSYKKEGNRNQVLRALSNGKYIKI